MAYAKWLRRIAESSRKAKVRRAPAAQRLLDGAADTASAVRTLKTKRPSVDGASFLKKPAFAEFTRAGVKSAGHMVSRRLRDTFACDLLSKGVPLHDVSKLLGHSSMVTTEKHYAPWIKGRQDRLASLVSATWKK
jgi:integrase